ncbi:DUF2332 domain-containing protein [Shimia aestuarii]|uniref:DUF2332 domain-containing protein n=1 Tax=Shimia aestuarii TaxID=254406 RepID=UPI001FB2C359|nr:DUF2332 family protein [Shimia aestuarii]
MIRDALRAQAGHCENLDSPFMGRLLRLLADHWPEDTALANKVAHWPGDMSPYADSLPLRIAGGLHALCLSGRDPSLAAAYPPAATDDPALWAALDTALHTHDAFLCDWIASSPQTNEVRRAAALIPVAHMLAARFGLPLRLSELGASGGLNLMFDRFALEADKTHFAAPDAAFTLAPDWTGPCPAPSDLHIADRRGVDLNPLDAHSPAGALRLMAYLWPDQSERLARTRAAIAAQDAPVDRADAIDWLAPRLSSPQEGTLHLVYHTVAWQYFPPEVQTRGTALIETAGAAATEAAPLAWLSMETDGQTPGAALSLRLWPGDHRLSLGRVDFHGRWIDWQGPTQLS